MNGAIAFAGGQKYAHVIDRPQSADHAAALQTADLANIALFLSRRGYRVTEVGVYNHLRQRVADDIEDLCAETLSSGKIEKYLDFIQFNPLITLGFIRLQSPEGVQLKIESDGSVRYSSKTDRDALNEALRRELWR